MQEQPNDFRTAVLHAADETMGIQPRTFLTIPEACDYIDELYASTVQKVPLHQSTIISDEVYQYILDNEDRIKDIAETLQARYFDDGFLNHLDIPTLNSIYMKCLHVEEILVDDEGNYIDGEEEEIVGKE